MIDLIRRSFSYLSKRERRTFSFLVAGRSLGSFLDLLGVALLGYLGTSVALFLSQGSDIHRTFSIGGLKLPAATIATLPAVLLATVSLFTLKAVISIVLTKNLAEHLALIEARAAREIAEDVLGDGLAEMRSVSQEELLYITTTGASSAISGLFNNVATLISEGFLFLSLVATFSVVDPLTTLIVLVYFGGIAYLMHYFTGSKLATQSDIIVKNTIQSNRAIIDLTSSFRELFVLNKRETYFDRLESARRDSAKAIGKQMYLAGMPRYVIETALLVGILAFAGFKLLEGDLASSITTIAVFFSGGLRIVAAMLPWQAALVSIRANGPQARLAHKHLFKLRQSASKSTPREEPLGQPGNSIYFSDVTFTYSEASRRAINNIDFSLVKPGLYSFIGESGSGKSTIADLAMGLLIPSRGQIRIGSLSPQELVKSHPGFLAYVPQSPGALSGTIRENITINSDPTLDNPANLDYALRNAHLKDFVAALPLGLETDLGNHSDSLSGGQIQRIGLARALYSRPSILVMDEATSALDAESENKITQALMDLKSEILVIVIAHRLNTVQYSDLVFLVDDGSILDFGTFAEITKRNPKVASAVAISKINAE